ncbi:condensation domain-containing protein [Streptomyces sp. NPDC093252]|uniref:condensation domain-containing protein n=1 Tax=Streptomyces sp. NPDC093252 TaxID=3154980 RepID=UPI00341F5F8A
MRITDIQRCEVRPGRLVEWTLSPATVATAAGLPDDTRPPAYIQESHIRTARVVREDGLYVPTWLGAAFDLAGPVDLDALQEALRGWTLRHETLRSGFRSAGGGGDSGGAGSSGDPGASGSAGDSGVAGSSGASGGSEGELRRFTLDAASVTLHREVVGDFTDPDVLVRHLQDRFDVAADALCWPNLIYTAVVRDTGASVYMAFDHSNVDAYSLHRIPAEIHELYAAAVAGRTLPEARVGSYVDFCESERADADRIGADHEIVGRWREFIRRCDGRLPSFPVDLGLTPGRVLPPQKLMREPLVDADTAAAFEARCRRYGGSGIGVLAATALVLREIGETEVYRTVLPFHTRAKSRWSESVGWYVGGAPIEVALEPGLDFTGALAAVRAEVHANRALARMPMARVLRLLGADFRPTSPDLYSIVSYVDARGLPGAERWAEQSAYALIRVSYGDQVCVWVNRLHEGLWLASRYPDTDVAQKNMRLYVERLRDVITEVSGG